MITSLSIENFALIEKLSIDFSTGFSIITGETGAGKSILLGALGLVLGKRADLTSLKNKDEKCSITTDPLNEWIQLIKPADGLILGSPVYYAGIAGTMKCFLDRAFYVAGVNGGLFRQKVAAAVVAVRRTGGSSTFDSLNHYLTYSEMILATSNYWNITHGRTPGEVLQDAEGVQIMDLLGRNMAWLLKMREETQTSIPRPESVDKIYTHFIR